MTGIPALRRAAPLAALLFAFTVLAWLPGLGRQPWVGTEDFRARIAGEMLDEGTWLVPTYYGRPVLTKPPLHYLALKGSFALTGRRDPLAARLVSLLALAATVAVLGAAVASAAGPQAGAVAGLGYLLGLNTLKNGANAEIDPFFAALVVAAVLAWWRSHLGTARRQPGWALAAGALAGLAAAAKGPAVLPFAAAAALAVPLSGGRLRVRTVLPALGGLLVLGGAWPLALALASPGATAGAITEGSALAFGWTPRMIWRTALYPVTLFAAALPFTLPALYRLRASGRAGLDRYLFATAAGALVLLLFPAGKSTRYLLPCFPLLVGAGVLRLELLARTGDFVRLAGLLFTAGAAAAGLLLAGDLPLSGWAVLGLVSAAGLTAFRFGGAHPVLALLLLAVPARGLFTAVWVPVEGARTESTAAVADRIRALLPPGPRLAVLRLETPRLLDALDREVVWFPEPADLAAARSRGERFDAVLLPWLIPADTPAGLRLAGSVAALGKDLRVYVPE